MAMAQPVDARFESEEVAIRAIDLHDLRVALGQGWSDFLSKRGDLVFIGVVYPLVVILAGMYVSQVAIVPLIFPLAAGLVLLGPAAASGFYEMARRREQGLDTSWRHFFDVIRGPAGLSILALTSIIALLFAVWIAVAWLVYANTLGPDFPTSVAAFIRSVLTTSRGWMLIVVGNLIGLCFAIVVLAISVVSFPMVVDKPKIGWNVAMHTSVRVARRSPMTTAVWGLIVVALLLLGAIPAFVGLAVVLPVLGYATWHLYTRAVVR